ncbi:MAG: hypothetical protein M1122_01190 [Candidatus Marsarchaeota archaeon]|jgi:predicted transcriptional regulator|nr:hypothetical protein [Candidatus Marsarchaeota archaeon]
MEPRCKSITRVILPAVRASVAQVLSKEYKYNQQQIADKLGIVQVAVSKYLSENYSKEVKDLDAYIIKNNLNKEIISAVISGSNIESVISKLCELLAQTY